MLSLLPLLRSARRVKQELAKQGLKPVDKAGAMLRIVLIAMFFSVELSYVLAELERKKELLAFAPVGVLPSLPQLYRFLSDSTRVSLSVLSQVS